MKRPRKDRAPAGLQQQKWQKQIAVDITARHFNGPVHTCSCTTNMQALLLTYFDAYTLSRGDLLSLSLAVPFPSL